MTEVEELAGCSWEGRKTWQGDVREGRGTWQGAVRGEGSDRVLFGKG